MGLTQLPDELFALILNQLSPNDVLRLRLCCRRFLRLSSEYRRHWRVSYIKDHGVQSLAQRCPKIASLALCNTSASGPTLQTSLPLFQALTSLDLEGVQTLTDNQLSSILAQLPNLEVLSLSRARNLSTGCGYLSVLGPSMRSLHVPEKTTDQGVAVIGSLLGLECLRMPSCRDLTSECCTDLARLTNLTELDLRSCSRLSDEGIECLSALLRLSTLNLSVVSQFSDVTYLPGFSALTSLRMDDCTRLSDLEGLSSLPALRRLSLDACLSLTDQQLSHLVTLATLTALIVSSCDVTDAGVLWLARMPLVVLDLKGTEITNGSLSHLSSGPIRSTIQQLRLDNCRELRLRNAGNISLPRLRLLDLANCADISREDLEVVVRAFPILESLSVYGLEGGFSLWKCTSVREGDTDCLSALTNLTHLELGYTKVDDAHLTTISTLTNLSSLGVERCDRVTGTFLSSACRYLTSLNLAHCPVTDTTLAHVSHLTNLQSICLYNCQRITTAGMEILGRLPTLCTIHPLIGKMEPELVAAVRKEAERGGRVVVCVVHQDCMLHRDRWEQRGKQKWDWL